MKSKWNYYQWLHVAMIVLIKKIFYKYLRFEKFENIIFYFTIPCRISYLIKCDITYPAYDWSLLDILTEFSFKEYVF